MILDHEVRLNSQRMPWIDPRDLPALWTPRQSYIWRKGTFTVPDTVSEDRVQFAASKYRNTFGQALEVEGFEVLGIEGPYQDHSMVAEAMVDPNRRPYCMRAKVRRRPEEIRVDVPDEDVPVYQASGFTLKD